MDGHRFDDLTRALATRGSRRGFLGGLLAAAAALRSRPAAAACPPDQLLRPGVGCVCRSTARPPAPDGLCPCPPGESRCGPACVRLDRDPDHCGACDHPCPDEGPCVLRACRAGACSPTPVPDHQPGACPPGLVCCAGACVDLTADPAHCGACGVSCDEGNPCTIDTCAGGTCLNTPVVCDRGPCEVGTCNPLSGECEYDPTPMEGKVCRPASGPCDQPEYCDGASGECPADAFQPSSVECQPATCVSGQFTPAVTCSGTSAECPAAQPVPCFPYVCNADRTACADACEDDGDCAGGAYCDFDGRCVPKAPAGDACEHGGQCQSGHCVGGVCCQQACPAPFGAIAACSDGGQTCEWSCDESAGYLPCGDACCPASRTCCNGVCCGEGGECVDGECTVTCLPLESACEDVDECCLSPFIDCAIANSSDPTCCHRLGGSCFDRGSFEECCSVEVDRAPGFLPVACSMEGICGGAGAECFGNEGCLSGICCGSVCCAANEQCSGDAIRQCLPAPGEPCERGQDCASGLCCGGVCVDANEEHCTACDDVCGVGEVCAGACLKDIGQPCSTGDECAAGYCYDGVCCDECGGLCGKPRPENMPCGGVTGSYCCNGECIALDPHWSQCGGCNVTCPYGDICTDDHECTCTESSSCPGDGPLNSHTCRGGSGHCITTTEDELACVQIRECGDSCNDSTDCPDTLVCTSGPNGVICSSSWVCSESTCCRLGSSTGKTCYLVMPGGRPGPA